MLTVFPIRNCHTKIDECSASSFQCNSSNAEEKTMKPRKIFAIGNVSNSGYWEWTLEMCILVILTVELTCVFWLGWGSAMSEPHRHESNELEPLVRVRSELTYVVNKTLGTLIASEQSSSWFIVLFSKLPNCSWLLSSVSIFPFQKSRATLWELDGWNSRYERTNL